MAIIDGFYGAGSGTIQFDNVACTGMEASLTDCLFDSDTSDCSHIQDAGVNCSLTCESN